MRSFTKFNYKIKKFINSIFLRSYDPLNPARLKHSIIDSLNDFLSKSTAKELVPDKFIIAVNPKIYTEKESDLDKITTLLKKEITHYYKDNDIKLNKLKVDIEITEDVMVDTGRIKIIPSITEDKYIDTLIKENNYILETVYGLDKPVKWYLEAGKCYIFGRDETCDCVINKKNVSRQHLRIIIDDEGNMLAEDLNSSNGTYLDDNPKRIFGKVIVKDGDTIQLCKKNPILIRVNKE